MFSVCGAQSVATACAAVTKWLIRFRFLGTRAEQDQPRLGADPTALGFLGLRPPDNHLDEGAVPTSIPLPIPHTCSGGSMAAPGTSTTVP